MILTPEALNSIRNYIKDSVSYAKFCVDGVWTDAQMQSIDLLDDGRITVTMMLGIGYTEPITITGVRVYSVNDVLVAQTVESIQCNAPEEGIFYRFRFSVEEVE